MAVIFAPSALPVLLSIFAVLAMGGLTGCKGPLRANVRTHVEAEIPPTQTSGPLVPMAIGRHQAAAAVPRVALIDVDGVLLNMDMTGFYSVGENPVSVFREKLDAVAADRCVRAVVIRINSPGGGVTASDIMRHELALFKARTGLPVIACLMDVGAGGGYYLATAADLIFAHPTTVTGGIGVILNLYNMQDTLAQFNVVGLPIKAGEHIDVGTPITTPTPEGREILQKMADEYHARFRDTVIAARGLAGSEVELFDGRVFTGIEALELRLVDEVGYLDDAIAAARGLGGLGESGGQVIIFHRCNDRARSPYAITPNVPLQATLFPLSVPGLDRARLPTFLYMWQPEPIMERLGGR